MSTKNANTLMITENADQPQWLTIDEAAEILNVRHQTIIQYTYRAILSAHPNWTLDAITGKPARIRLDPNGGRTPTHVYDRDEVTQLRDTHSRGYAPKGGTHTPRPDKLRPTREDYLALRRERYKKDHTY